MCILLGALGLLASDIGQFSGNYLQFVTLKSLFVCVDSTATLESLNNNFKLKKNSLAGEFYTKISNFITYNFWEIEKKTKLI